MNSFKGPCPHQSAPVETDERTGGLDLDWPPPCSQCSEPVEFRKRSKEEAPPQRMLPNVGPPDLCRPYGMPPAEVHPGPVNLPYSANDWPRDLRQQGPRCEWDLMDHHNRGFAKHPNWSWGHSMEEKESLEQPHTLISHKIYMKGTPSPFPGTHLTGPGPVDRGCRCACCPPPNPPHHHKYYQDQVPHPQQLKRLQPTGPPESWVHGSGLQHQQPLRDIMHEVTVNRPGPPGGVMGEMKRTISLPEECRKLFITYSVDIGEEIFPFVKFLIGQGFKPSIDMFESSLQSMGINKWMDSFLNDKSVLIIVVISPKYKEDVEGIGDDDHGLHTKYIHSQIQNEYIQQGCLNFRLVPVLFPNATKTHVPSWLQSTRIFRWPHDTEDLLLRLLREERYIMPQRGTDLTLTVRPI
ncbi:E3 ubiquitin ligase TRAF3IP2 [Pholidichthys leucotaenia]